MLNYIVCSSFVVTPENLIPYLCKIPYTCICIQILPTTHYLSKDTILRVYNCSFRTLWFTIFDFLLSWKLISSQISKLSIFFCFHIRLTSSKKEWQKVPGEDVEPLQATTEPPHTHTHTSPAATSPATSPENQKTGKT